VLQGLDWVKGGGVNMFETRKEEADKTLDQLKIVELMIPSG
jgi:hypothetical protein